VTLPDVTITRQLTAVLLGAALVIAGGITVADGHDLAGLVLDLIGVTCARSQWRAEWRARYPWQDE